MAMSMESLADLIIQRAFDPVMLAKPGGRSDADRRALERVQQATRSEIERYRTYGSDQDVLTNFKRDLHSSAAKKVHAELRRLHLPTIEDIEEEVAAKAHQLGIET
jgi:hypothetical protein